MGFGKKKEDPKKVKVVPVKINKKSNMTLWCPQHHKTKVACGCPS